MKTAFIAIGLASAFSLQAWAADPGFRQLGKHQHGHGALNIAIEGNTIALELEAPGADIVGFEHDAVTPAEKAEFERAKAKLSAPLTLFNIPAEAHCTVLKADIALHAEDHDDDHDEAHEKGEAHHHSDFHVTYALDCKAPELLSTLSLDYFKDFANAQELDVAIIGPKGQKAQEVTRQQPTLDLSGVL